MTLRYHSRWKNLLKPDKTSKTQVLPPTILPAYSDAPQPPVLSSSPAGLASDQEDTPLSPNITSVVPRQLMRYSRKVPIKQEVSKYILQPLETDFSSNIPSGWTQFMHPDGAPFFYHEEKRILTDANLLDDQILSRAHHIIVQIEDYLRSKSILLPVKVELVIDLYDEPERDSYYCVDHDKRCLFWLKEHDISHMLEGVKGVTAKSHINLEMMSQYWRHWEVFPNNQIVTHEILDEVMDMLIKYTADVLTNKHSTAPYNQDELQSMINLVDKARKLVGTKVRGSPWFIGRLMSQLLHHQFINSRGQYGQS